MLKYKYTDSLGYFYFSDLEPGYYAMKISLLGYADTIFTVGCIAGKPIDVEIDLKLKSVYLETISVVEKAAILRKSGDTTTFNLNALSRKNELSATDIIDRIPGMNISNNKITYMGKVLDRILVDGVDVSDGNHLGFTDHIPFSAMESVSILENYDELGLANIDSSNLGIAMLIKLKKGNEHKSKISSNLKVGHPASYVTENSFYRIRNNTGLRAFLALNNTYTSIDQSDTRFIEDNIKSALFLNNKQIFFNSRSANSYNDQSDKIYDRTEALGKIIGNLKVGKLMRIKSENTFYDNSYLSGQRIYEDFFFTEASRIEINTGRGTSQRWNSNTNIDLRINGTTNVKIFVPFLLDNGTTDKNQELSQNSLLYQTSKDGNIQALSLNPYYVLNHSVSDKVRIKLFGHFHKEVGDERYFYQSDNFESLHSFTSTNGMNFSQSRSMEKLEFEQQYLTDVKLDKWQITYSGGFKSTRQNLSLKSEEALFPTFTGTDFLATNFLHQSIHSRLEKKKIRLVFGLNAFSAFTNHSTVAANLSKVRPYLLFLKKIKGEWNFSTSFKSEINQPELNNITTLSWIQNLQLVNTGGLDAERVEDKRIVSANFFRNFETGEKVWHFNSSIVYTFPFNSIVTVPVQTNTYLAMVNAQRQVMQMMHSSLYVARYTKDMKISFRLGAEQSSFFIDGQETTRFGRNLSLSGKWRHGDFSIASSLDYSFFKFYSDRFESVNQYFKWSNRLAYERKGIKQYCYLSTLYNKLNETITYTVISYGVSLKPSGKDYEWSLNLNNILNVGSSVDGRVTSTANFNRFTEYQVQSGNILLGIKFFL